MAAPAGFYPNPDPNEPNLERYWDGQRWTNQTRPVGGGDWEPPQAKPSTTGAPSVSPILAEHGHDDPAPSGRSTTSYAGTSLNQAGPVAKIIPILISLVFIASGFFMWKSMSPDMEQPTPVTATVVDIEENYSYKDGRQSRTCQPVVEFRAKNEQVYRVAPPFSSSDMCGYGIGQTVQIEYDAADPNKISGLSGTFGSLFPLLFMGVGIMVLVAMLWQVFRRGGGRK